MFHIARSTFLLNTSITCHRSKWKEIKWHLKQNRNVMTKLLTGPNQNNIKLDVLSWENFRCTHPNFQNNQYPHTNSTLFLLSPCILFYLLFNHFKDKNWQICPHSISLLHYTRKRILSLIDLQWILGSIMSSFVLHFLLINCLIAAI